MKKFWKIKKHENICFPTTMENLFWKCNCDSPKYNKVEISTNEDHHYKIHSECEKCFNSLFWTLNNHKSLTSESWITKNKKWKLNRR
ncbi:hypothetical protein ELUCI_v1c05100 [Williamsoniiplasma lucivorax]|uniref:Uncharacterized protein n=1 Tax=Williamsoniiplasma lucivorax TaxID=209274 RepID=A0A2S5RDP2_9MOLU|nr:hypothetical protein ELUCI_v1c05100 [Williamsoniiplasma lucivorax]